MAHLVFKVADLKSSCQFYSNLGIPPFAIDEKVAIIAVSYTHLDVYKRQLLTRLDKQFDRLMAEEENSDGCFTRAYIRAAFSEGAAERKMWGALLSLSLIHI